MSSEVFSKVVTQLAVLPEYVQNQVLVFIETLRGHINTADDAPTTPDPYPLRGEVYAYIDPCEPAVPADQWHAVNGNADDHH